jgi:YHS domain-containing protein
MQRSAVFSILAAPSLAQSGGSCTDPSYGPVLSGIDFVDLQELKTEAVDAPDFGASDFTAELNGYTFYFKNAENQAKFVADPWKYAPQYGGF